ncbi:MAG TPA: hypothetical protein VFV15_04155 [Moraxellaceae bacterium]|nr:hypothetical protein [Moraxellaceae bacterium]
MMGNKGRGRWAALLAASFVVHAALLVNSTETALWNEQGREGVLLSQQLADAAAPLVLSRDMVSLSVLASRYEDRPGIASVRLFSTGQELLAETGTPRSDGRLFSAPLVLQQQGLGRVELRLAAPARSQIVREQMANLGVMAMLHLLVFGAGMALASRGAAPGGRAARGASPGAGAPAGSDAPAARPAAAPVPAEDPLSAPAAPPATLLHIAIDDPNSLLTRISAALADEMLELFDQFVDRAARLYGGEVLAPFSPAGVLVRFRQAEPQERELHALAAAGLFLQLVQDASEERMQHHQLCLGAKAGVLHGEDAPDTAAVIAHTAPAGRILTTLPVTPTAGFCRLGTAFQLAVSTGAVRQVAVVDDFAPEYRHLIASQSEQILLPAGEDD